MAEAAGVTPDELHHLFRRWAGLTPKAFLQAMTLDHAKAAARFRQRARRRAGVRAVGPGRLHDLFVTHEAMSPGEWKAGGAGLTLRYGFHPSPFGTAIVIASGAALRGLPSPIPARSRRRSPTCSGAGRRATYVEDRAGTADARATHLRPRNCGAPTSRCAWC